MFILLGWQDVMDKDVSTYKDVVFYLVDGKKQKSTNKNNIPSGWFYTKIWVFPLSFKDLAVNTLELLETQLKWCRWNIPMIKNANHILKEAFFCYQEILGFGSRTILNHSLQVMDGAFQINWILMALIPLRHMKCAHDILPMKTQEWPPPLKWPDSQHKKMQGNLYCPPLPDVLSPKLLPWPLRSFQVGGLSLSLLCSKGYLMKKSRTVKFMFMIHDANFQAQIPSTSFLILLHFFSLHFLNLPDSTRWTRKSSFKTPSRCRC